MFIASFLKKGQNLSLKIGNDTRVYSVKRDGKFANDVLSIGSAEYLGMDKGKEVVGRTLLTKPDGNEIDQDGMGGSDNSYDARGKVVEQIWLKTNRKVDDAISILGHEAFVHAIPDMNKLRELRNELNDGTIKPGTKVYEMKLQAMTQSGDADHRNLANEKSAEYKTFSQQLDAVKSTTKFIKAYNKDVKDHK